MAKTYFQWAEFRSTKAGIKLHTKFNLNKGIPELIIVSNAKPHDRTKMKELITENNCIYVFDKGYVDYKKFDEFSEDRKSTRLNSSHANISYAVFCLKKKNNVFAYISDELKRIVQ